MSAVKSKNDRLANSENFRVEPPINNISCTHKPHETRLSSIKMVRFQISSLLHEAALEFNVRIAQFARQIAAGVGTAKAEPLKLETLGKRLVVLTSARNQKRNRSRTKQT